MTKVRVFGNGGDDVIAGSQLADQINGGADNDFLLGGLGDDQLNGGPGVDTLLEKADVNFSLADDSLTGLGIDALLSIERAELTGGAAANTFRIRLLNLAA